jgi:uncharacterized membrane protein
MKHFRYPMDCGNYKSSQAEIMQMQTVAVKHKHHLRRGRTKIQSPVNMYRKLSGMSNGMFQKCQVASLLMELTRKADATAAVVISLAKLRLRLDEVAS